MPCVFPVLSLKALSLTRAGREGQRSQSLAYSAGVVLSCVGAAALILALQRAGQAVGWGFQLQSAVVRRPADLPTVRTGPVPVRRRHIRHAPDESGSGAHREKGLAGAFFTGVLAVVVASPCTAPFMGTALGYAVTQPPVLALTVFAALGLGLALPFLIIGFVPGAARLLPRPGAWMERFKQLMAFPLYLSVVWLLWVLARQLDVSAAAH